MALDMILSMFVLVCSPGCCSLYHLTWTGYFQLYPVIHPGRADRAGMGINSTQRGTRPSTTLVPCDRFSFFPLLFIDASDSGVDHVVMPSWNSVRLVGSQEAGRARFISVVQGELSYQFT